MAMVKEKVLSCAKINLMLRILGKRNDGYHELQTYFQLLNWGDQIEFTEIKTSGDNLVTIQGFKGLKQSDNLIYKAANALLPYASKRTDWLIKVNKIIPSGAGLGGGSSNAAMTLKFLNKHWACQLSDEQLMTIGQSLGADIPVFIGGKSAMATGIGEQLEFIEFSTPYILLMFPDVSINTAQLFNHESLKRDQVKFDNKILNSSKFWINDFFPLVLACYPGINHIYQALKNTIDVRLSGSGSTLFAVFDNEKEALNAMNLSSSLVNSCIVQPLNV